MSLVLFIASGRGTNPPSVPANLAAPSATGTSVSLTWDASTNSPAGYEYRVDGGSPVDAGNVLLTTVSGLTASTLYSFEVRAYNAGGERSAWSSAVGKSTSGGTVPASIAGLKVWWKADALGLADGATVSSWSDSSASGIYDGTASGSPIYKTGIVNGLPIVRFNGTTDYFDFNIPPGLTSGEAFMVFKLDNDPPGSDGQSGFWGLGLDGTGTHLPYTNGLVYDSFGTTARKDTGVNTGGGLDVGFHIWDAYSAPGDWGCFLDGSTTAFYSTGTNTVGFPAVTASVGRHGNASYKLDGDIAEFLLFDHKLTLTDRADVITYLQAKYAI